jgi:glycosyltransferase involved in cell wall biosynthesis
MTPHTLSVIICTKDREESLRACLDSLFHQSRLPGEVIIVDDGNLNGAAIAALAESHGIRSQYLKKESPGLTASRNTGVEHAQGDVVLFLDDDVVLGPGYVAGIVEVFDADLDGTVGGATGVLRIHYRPGIPAFLRFFGLDGRQPGAILPSGYGVPVREGELTQPTVVQWLSGCNMAYRRQVFDKLRFDQRLGTYGWGEDRDFSFRVAHEWTLVATPKAELVHTEAQAGRIDGRLMGYMETSYFFRFFRENMPKRLANWLSFAWAIVGILVKNLLQATGRADRGHELARLRGNLDGLWAIITRGDRQ